MTCDDITQFPSFSESIARSPGFYLGIEKMIGSNARDEIESRLFSWMILDIECRFEMSDANVMAARVARAP